MIPTQAVGNGAIICLKIATQEEPVRHHIGLKSYCEAGQRRATIKSFAINYEIFAPLCNRDRDPFWVAN